MNFFDNQAISIEQKNLNGVAEQIDYSKPEL
jgi:hypothetical protein